jgi:S-methylmethionine-dependent homocysteine/selenocysteine methylase
MTPAEMRAWLERPRVLDGAIGSELIQRGVAGASVLWGVGALIDAPDRVLELHREYAAAGAEALTASTFRVAPYSLREVGLADRTAELASAAVALARQGAAQGRRGAIVLAAQTTLEDCYRANLVPDDETLAREHRATASALAAAGADAIMVETINTAREARAAARAASETGLAVLVSFSCISNGRLLSGEDVGFAAQAVAGIEGVVAIGVNCTAIRQVMPALVRIAESTELPLVAYGNNAWYAEDSAWLAATEVTPARYGCAAIAWAAAGARLIGGCCGTTPAHIEAVAARLRHR